MTCAQVRDYLQTQGLKLPEQEVRMAMLVAQSVLELAQAEIDMSVLWYEENGFSLAEKFNLNTNALRQTHPADLFTSKDNIAYTLRQLYLALDSIASRHHNDVFALYLYEGNNEAGELCRLLARGYHFPAVLSCAQQQLNQYLFARTASTGWLNQINNVQMWINDSSLTGGQSGASQLAVPVTGEEGQVLGVLFAAHQQQDAITDTELIDWIALAMVITPLMHNLHNAATTHTKG